MVKEPTIQITRSPTGIKGLDKIISGGLAEHNVVMVRGEAGTGKTLLCLEYLYRGIERYNEPGLFISFAESKKAIMRHGKTFGWDMKKLEEENRLNVIRYEPHEVVSVMEEGGGTIRDTLESMKAKRLVIDSLTAYALLFTTPYKAVESILSLFDMLNRWEVTTMVTLEHPFSMPQGKAPTGNLGFLADGIIDLYYNRNKQNERVRRLEVLKMRDTMHSHKLLKFKITKNGVVVETR